MFKPIETEYLGFRFRSRREARFAVCFEALGLMWDYETEGFQLNGYRYLPDFLLRELNTWVEVKGRPPTLEEFEKATMLAQYDKQRQVIITWERFREMSADDNLCIWHDRNGVLHSRGGIRWLENPEYGWRCARWARFERGNFELPPLEIGEAGYGELPF